jgi:hypothetical protein
MGVNITPVRPKQGPLLGEALECVQSNIPARNATRNAALIHRDDLIDEMFDCGQTVRNDITVLPSSKGQMFS